MIFEQIKKKLYFPLAAYFRFFAKIRIKRWHPKIIVVTGSNGKTTLLHLLESQIGEKAKFSHHANSAYGVPFDILDLHRKSFALTEWFDLFLQAPGNAFKKPPREKLYVVESDCDRSGEGKFLAEFLRPEVVLWTSVSRTHSMNFDHLVTPSVISSDQGESRDLFATVDEAIAYEYGYFLEYCKKLAVINGDAQLQVSQVKRTKAHIKIITKEKYLEKYSVEKEKTVFHIDGKSYTFSSLLPEEMCYAIEMCRLAVKQCDLPFDTTFSKLVLPPGRSSLFPGLKDTTLVDSTYNANLSSIIAMLTMFAKFPAKKKIVVVGDMMELGAKEQEEHEQLGEFLTQMNLDKILLVGPRTKKYTLSKIKTNNAHAFLSGKEAVAYLEKNISGGEAILFKGSQSLLLEGMIEKLLKNTSDLEKLPRRGIFWDQRRNKLGYS